MASHRKSRSRPKRSLASSTARTAALLALTGAVSATVLEGTGHADPHLTTAQVKARVDQYQREAEEATDKYNGAREKADEARRALGELRDEAARRAARLNTARNALGAYATAQYRAGTVAPTLQLALSSSPEEYLQRASLVERAAGRQAATIIGITRQEKALRRVRGAAADRLAELRTSQEALSRHKRAVEKKLAAADRLLDRLTAEQRRRLQDRQPHSDTGHTADQTAAPAATTGRAARAVAFARGALGKPYVWGATGPHGYDCSGLTQAAWRAAGVSLPRTTYTQITAGRRVGRSQLAPGDLVFFYSGISHVGIYIGDGRMIHAPHPGAPVRVAPVDQMPFAGASRPA
ncbi:C40 family peptidase [Streptomyces sp. NA02950]|uniref:C40 family peptidase n=1 Tax=Streptomyces sp. NA02950 TaxID=2742137 RepID=UPI00158FBF40|nr:C40 family peptidase [Streptomyces sp. NA02950]QKV94412.1 C40 family peptidase [Streptomyces sp. NA02950]